ncbi:Dehydrogenase citC [Exophiala dermatitidis]
MLMSNLTLMIGRKEYDWCMTSIPQPNAGNKIYSMPRGKALGGSSAINYLMYVRPAKNCVNHGWEAMGNPGWGWEGLAPYFRKHQTLDKTPVHEDPQFMPIAGGDKFHGNDGPIHTSFNDWYMPLEVDFAKAAYEVTGTKKTIHDAWSGDHMGFYSSLGVVNRTDDPGKRSYAATGYLRPNLNRPNLRVLTEAQATRIILDGNTAKGVEFLYGGSQKYSVYATREVILSAGVIQSPQLLELSGIGDPEVLSAAGVECAVENKAVGANFQDHVLGGLLFDLKPGIDSMDALRDEQYMKMQQEVYQKTQKGPYASPGMMMGFVSYASLVSPEELEATIREIEAKSLAKTDFEKAQEKVIVDQLRDPTFANLQTFCIPCRLDVAKGSDQTQFFGAPPTGKQQVSLLMCLEHPLSRGTVHITTSDPLAPPRIDPGYFRNEVDAKILAAGIAWMDKVARHPLLAKSLADRELPPQDQNMDTQEKWVDYVKNHISTQYHLIGTCALGQAVDNELRVKGVKGLRVVDASVFPGHVSGNIMATTYAVAEKGADLIKADI